MSKSKLLLDRSGRLLFLLLLWLTVFSFAMFQGGFVSWFIFYVTLPFLLHSFVAFFIRENIVAIERVFEPNRVNAGEDVLVTIKVTRKTIFPFIYMTINEQSNVEEKLGQKIFSRAFMLVGWRKQFEWRYTMQAIPRGEYHFSELEVTFHDFFGWVPQTIYVRQEQTLVVYPTIHELQYAPHKIQYQSGYMSSKQSLEKDTTLVTGIRNYQAGDRFSWIHWKSFAKSNVLYTKEFEDRKSQELVVLLDGSVSEQFDDVVELTASIVHAIVKKQGDVSLLSVGKNRAYFPRIQSGSQLDKVMHHLAIVEADATKGFTNVLMNEQVIGQGASLLIVTAQLTDEKLMTLSKIVKQHCYCLVVAEQLDSDEGLRKKLSNVTVYTTSKGNYYNVFTEVMKP